MKSSSREHLRAGLWYEENLQTRRLVTSQLVFLSLQLPFACARSFYKLKGRGKVRGVILLFLRALSICQTIPVALGISLLIKSIQPQQ